MSITFPNQTNPDSAVKRAVIYARYSCSGQGEQSIEGQLRDNYAFAQREGIQVVGEYIDRALTGRYDDRPEFQRMINESRSKQFDYVIVWKLDRFARNRYDSAIYKHKLKANGVKVLSSTENIGDNPESIILEAVLEASAEYYSVDLRQKVVRGRRESVLKGSSVGGTVPLGYKIVDKRYVIDEQTAPIVTYAVQEYSLGTSLREIAEALNAKGYKTGDGKPFAPHSFSRMFRNQKYIGIYECHGAINEDSIPPIISKELFQKAQLRREAARRAPAMRRSKTNYLLSGKLFCGLCGATIIGECGRGKGGTVYHYYSCSNRKNKSVCKKSIEKKDFLEWYVVEQTLHYVLQPDRMDYIAGRVVDSYNSEFNDDHLKALTRRISKIDRDIDKCIEMMLESDVRTLRARMEAKIKELELQKDDLSIDLSKLQIANQIRYSKDDIISWLDKFCHGDLMDEAFRTRIIDVLINSVFLYEEKVIIFYNAKDCKQISYIDSQSAALDFCEQEKSSNTDKSVRASSTMVDHQGLEPWTP